MAKARYLREVSKLADKIKTETVSTLCDSSVIWSTDIILQGQDGTSHYLVEAKLAVLNKQFKQAEAILLERVSTQPREQLLEMFTCVFLVPM